MMKLILTEKEKKAATWCELEDESLGKVIKSMMFRIKQASEEKERLPLLSAAMMLCSATAETNADTATFTVEGLKNKTNDFGNWKVVIKRIKPKECASFYSFFVGGIIKPKGVLNDAP
jgi:hypothetical protein